MFTRFMASTVTVAGVTAILGLSASANAEGYARVPDAAISGHNHKQLSGVTVAECKAACSSEASFTCKSFDYHKWTSKCDLSSKSASEAGGLKSDYSGNPYDHYARTSDYAHFPDAAISGWNQKQLSGVTVAQCKAACSSEAEFTCRSFDYYKSENKCDLSVMSPHDVGGLKFDYSGDPYDHYARDIEPLTPHGPLQWTAFTKMSGTSRRGPHLIEYDGKLVMAIRSNGPDGSIYVRTATRAGARSLAWSGGWTEIQGSTLREPTLAVWRGKLWMAIRSNDGQGDLYINSTTNPLSWPAWRKLPHGSTVASPGLAAHNDRLFYAVRSRDIGGWGQYGGTESELGDIYITSSADGVSWPPFTRIDDPNARSSDGPSIISFGGRLIMAVRAEYDGRIRVSSSVDGTSWEPFKRISGTTSQRPFLAVYQGKLYMAVRNNEKILPIGDFEFKMPRTQALYIADSADGITWSDFASLPSGSSSFGPAIASFEDMLVMGVRSNSSGSDGSELYWAAADLP